MKQKEIVLSVKDLKINFSTDHGYVQAVRGVSFDLYKGETLCIVGESGSGKSVTSKAIMGILAANGRIMNGSIMYQGEDLTKVSEDEFHRIRGHKIGMIFQDPLSSLNPIVKIGKQITEAMLINSSRLKKMFDDLVAEQLTKYKNAQTEYRLALNAGKEKVKFLKGEKKKEIEKVKNEPSILRDGRKYALDIEYNGQKVALKDIYKEKILANPEQKENLEEELKTKLLELKTTYLDELNAIKVEYAEMKLLAIKKLAKTREDYDAQIAQAKEESLVDKEGLDEKFIPLISEAKAAYLEECKKARVTVKEYKEKLKAELDIEISKILEEHADNKQEAKKLIKEAKERYIAKIRITPAEAKNRALQIMREVGISEPEKRYNQYPFEFSGGMRQRIVIAIALTADPDILICDEPTTALDVTIQAQILELINRLKKERGISCIFITHDLGVVANMADRVAVMYAGKIVEYGTEKEIFYDPRHPYTWALLSSIPDVNSKEKLEAIPGTPPNMVYPPKGDAFALRSKYALAIDFKKEPPYFKVSDTHYAATWLLDPRAPKVEMPKIVKTRIENSLRAAEEGGLK